MSHVYARNHIHVVFSTKGRRGTLKRPMQDRLWAYMRGIARNYNIDVEGIGGTEDHVHLLIVLPPKLSLADAVRVLKANSSKWMNETGHWFAWQEGYAAFSVSSSNVNVAAEYVRNQAEHHRRRSFEEEFMALLRKHGIDLPAAEVLSA